MQIDDLGLVACLGVITVWLILLTVALWRRRREADEIVYKRMPNGRIRFEWSVHTSCHAAQRAAQGPDPPLPPGSAGHVDKC